MEETPDDVFRFGLFELDVELLVLAFVCRRNHHAVHVPKQLKLHRLFLSVSELRNVDFIRQPDGGSAAFHFAGSVASPDCSEGNEDVLDVALPELRRDRVRALEIVQELKLGIVEQRRQIHDDQADKLATVACL